jgi:hypothetical protein
MSDKALVATEVRAAYYSVRTSTNHHANTHAIPTIMFENPQKERNNKPFNKIQG